MKEPIWHKELETGIKQFDDNNKIIVVLLGKLLKMLTEEGMNLEFHKIYATLLVYARKEFDIEEHLMTKAEYEQTIFHTNQHNEFINKMEYFAEQYLSGEKPLLEFQKYATKWTENHIKVADKRFVPVVKEYFLNNL